MAERVKLLRLFLLRGEVVGNLDIISLTRLIDDEIDFELLAQALAAAVPAERLNDAHIDMLTANAQLIIYDVLHDVSRLLLTEIQPGVAQTEVGEVIFEIGTDIAANMTMQRKFRLTIPVMRSRKSWTKSSDEVK